MTQCVTCNLRVLAKVPLQLRSKVESSAHQTSLSCRGEGDGGGRKRGERGTEEEGGEGEGGGGGEGEGGGGGEGEEQHLPTAFAYTHVQHICSYTYSSCDIHSDTHTCTVIFIHLYTSGV